MLRNSKSPMGTKIAVVDVPSTFLIMTCFLSLFNYVSAF